MIVKVMLPDLDKLVHFTSVLLHHCQCQECMAAPCEVLKNYPFSAVTVSSTINRKTVSLLASFSVKFNFNAKLNGMQH